MNDSNNDFVRLALLMLRRAGGEMRISDEEIGEMNLIEEDYVIEASHDEWRRETVLRMKLKPHVKALADLEATVKDREA
ncbi:hypothetical protein AB0383_20525 [Amycolatopsis sp. NPDC051373]|uniref:hypothetical protein n=1 Tax=Amycolatopsis sp. NPDC051373 TaxID=3155801 RepID=UPI00344D7D0A